MSQVPTAVAYSLEVQSILRTSCESSGGLGAHKDSLQEGLGQDIMEDYWECIE